MLSCMLSYTHQTHDRISVYLVPIISYHYPDIYLIMTIKRTKKVESKEKPMHKSNKCNNETLKILIYCLK